MPVKDSYFASGKVLIGGKELPFVKRGIQGNYSMYVPEDFFEDKNLISQYTYLFSKDKSPLSIAIKFSKIEDEVTKAKKIEHYFGQAKEGSPNQVETLEPGITYRETVTGGTFMSIYSLRFAIEMADGLLFGCFNCAAEYREDWRECVLEIIRNIEPGNGDSQ